MHLRAELVDRAQELVLIATVALTPLVYSRWTFDVFNITEVTALWVGVVVASSLQLAVRLGGWRLERPVVWRYVVAYLLVLGVATAASRAPAVSFLGMYGRLGGLTTILPTAMLAWLVYSQLAGRPDRRRHLVTAVAGSAALGAAYLLAQQFDIDSHRWLQFQGREPTHPPGLLGNANFSGAHIAMGLGPMLWLAARSAGRRRGAWLLALVCGLTAVGVSQSRGAMVAAGLGLGATALQLKLPRRVLAVGAIAAGAAIGIAALSTNPVGFDDITSAATADERLDLWKVALEASTDHLLLGGGPDLYLVTFGGHAGAELDGVVADDPHNVLLDHLDGSGLLGAAAWLALVAAVVVAARTGDRRDLAPWVGMGVAYLTQAMLSIDAVPLLVWGWVAGAGLAAPSSRRVHAGTGKAEVAATSAAAAALCMAVGLLLAIQPFRADMAYRRGVEASNAGDEQTALAQFAQAVDRHGWEPRYHRRLGLALWGSAAPDGRDTLEEARAALVDALDLFPDDPSANVWFAGVEEQLEGLDG